jgi:ribosome biogenesis protein ERB1
MATRGAKKKTLKRKTASEDEVVEADDFGDSLANLEMLTDEEGDDDASSEGGETDEFPEIDEGSSSEDEDGSADEGEDEKDGSTAEDENSDTDTLDHEIFPRAKTVISGITGQPKRVYPEIEPEYDSDSSTEDVRTHRIFNKIKLTMG